MTTRINCAKKKKEFELMPLKSMSKDSIYSLAAFHVLDARKHAAAECCAKCKSLGAYFGYGNLDKCEIEKRMRGGKQ